MEVWSSAMGPERVLPSSEDELGEDERPADGALLPVGAVWNGGEGGGEDEEGEEEEEEGGEMELDGEEEENSGGYYYQPLNQDPDGLNASEPPEEEGEEEEEEEEEDRGGQQEEEEAPSHAEQLQQVQQRIEVMGLHLPEAPPPDSDEEEDPEGAAALRSRASIPMDADHVELVKRTMAAVALPSLGVPAWAQEISDDQWKDMVQHTLQSRQSAGALRINRRNNINGP
ncbi:male-enhanced antigen 1-like [Seriola lalandi dorsalis]|uniref:Male-enhanced antigen 1 n=1 Tax=Seriola lalandi dorsalis TaxID=1841481 RepID=A0A3B4Y4Z1_SERLL|nr:male-enhanced antigen 1-like [Seriola lalandi dorsalis]XP_023251423.1 male-enhanced antigen 1-like [Seriola lalandi dorsalis]XP_056251062.1 male-enhanced antigen 1 [Seriola aureovittata]